MSSVHQDFEFYKDFPFPPFPLPPHFLDIEPGFPWPSKRCLKNEVTEARIGGRGVSIGDLKECMRKLQIFQGDLDSLIIHMETTDYVGV